MKDEMSDEQFRNKVYPKESAYSSEFKFSDKSESTKKMTNDYFPIEREDYQDAL